MTDAAIGVRSRGDRPFASLVHLKADRFKDRSGTPRSARWRVGLTALAPLLLVGICLATTPAPSPASTEPGNLQDAKNAVIAYHDSGAYDRDLATVAAEATAWIRDRASRRAPGERLAVVLDIDETTLSTYDFMRTQDFGYTPGPWNDAVNRGVFPPVTPMLEFYKEARALDIAVLFVTGRHDPRDRAGTEANLTTAGYTGYERLIMVGAKPGTNTTRKLAARQQLAAEGFVIIANIGDQQSDLEGGAAERTFKLPNPFYRVD